MIWSLAASLLASGVAIARDNLEKKIDVQLEAGDTYVINQLSRDSAARITVISNPNALVVNGGVPGKLMLVGAEAGCWEIAAEHANGERVTYDVTVTSIARPFSDPLAPGKFPDLPDPKCKGVSARLKPGLLAEPSSTTIDIND
jgi:hypothetical protein